MQGSKSRVLVLAPTRELAVQIEDEIHGLSYHTTVTSAAVYGGVELGVQERALRGSHRRGLQVAAAQGIHDRLIGLLQLQEVRVAANSIRTPVQAGDVGGDHLLRAPVQVPVGEVDVL